MRVVQEGDRVQVHCVKIFQDGSVVSTRGKTPIELTVGVAHRRLPGLGLALVGLGPGESRTLIVPARHAYGPYDPGLVRCRARERFAAGQEISPGKWVRLGHSGHRRLVRVVEVRRRGVVVDGNRRWAGQSLELEVEVVSIRGPANASGATAGQRGGAADPGRDFGEDGCPDGGRRSEAGPVPW